MVSTAGMPGVARPPQIAIQTIPIQVVRREVLSPDVVSLFFAKPGTRQAPAPALPGQFVTLVLPGHYDVLYRSYSLSGGGNPHEPWEITIKRVKQGVVSNYLFDAIQVGMVLQATPPRGTFILPQQIRRDMSFIFIAAGSGITPIRGMLRALAALPEGHRPQVQLHYASHSPDDIIYRAELAQLDPQHRWLRQWHYLGSQGTRMTPEAIITNAGTVPHTAHWYVCGQDALRHAVQSALGRRGVPPVLIHAEVFADQSRRRPLHNAVGPTVARVAIQDTGALIDVRAQETLLEALERHGYRPDFSCRSGSCSTCKLRVLGGRVGGTGPSGGTGHSALTPAERAAGYVLSCVAHPQGDVLIQSGGRPPTRGHLPGINLAAQRAGAKRSLRLATVAVLGFTLTGLWGLTGHKPADLHLSLPSVSVPSAGPGSSSPDDNHPVFNNPGNQNPAPIPTVTTRQS